MAVGSRGAEVGPGDAHVQVPDKVCAVDFGREGGVEVEEFGVSGLDEEEVVGEMMGAQQRPEIAQLLSLSQGGSSQVVEDG